MIHTLSKALSTLTSTRSQSDIWQDKLYFHPENKAAEGHLLPLVCSPSTKQLLLDQLTVLWVLINMISLQVYQQHHTSNNSINKAKKKSPSAAGLRRCRNCSAKIILSAYGLLFVTAGYWESCPLMIHLLHSSAQVISSSPQKRYCHVLNKLCKVSEWLWHIQKNNCTKGASANPEMHLYTCTCIYVYTYLQKNICIDLNTRTHWFKTKIMI